VFRQCLGVVFGNLGITCDSFVSAMCRSIDHSPLLNEKRAICLVAKKTTMMTHHKEFNENIFNGNKHLQTS
jgi:hypothetical protein